MTLNNMPYKSQTLLGGGENASVYLAIERTTGKKIALKVSKPGCERIIQHEGQLTQKIASKVPYVRRVVNLGQTPTGEFYVAYEFVEQTLATYLKARRKQNKPLTLQEASEILMPIAQALDQLHYHFEMAHSDLKPDNILIGENGSVWLADFGNATPFGTTAQQVSPFYMTPEQANNQPCQPASDVYGLALILYETLTLSRPIQSENPVTMSIQVLKQKPIPILNLRPDIQPRVAQNIMRGLQKAPAARPKQTSSLLAGFPPPKIKYGPPISQPPNIPKVQPKKKKSRSKWPLLVPLVLLLLLIFSGGGYVLGLFDEFLEEPAVEEPAIAGEEPQEPQETEEPSTLTPEPVEPSVTSSPTPEKEVEDEQTQAEEPTEENPGNGEATATRRPTPMSTRRPTFTPTVPVTPTSSPLPTNTQQNIDEPIPSPSVQEAQEVQPEATITVAPTFTSINSTPSPTIAPPTIPLPTIASPTNVPPTSPTIPTIPTIPPPTSTPTSPPTSAPPTSTSTIAPPTITPSATIQPTVPIPTTVVPSPTVQPTLPPPTKTATQPPANYNQAPEIIEPSNGEVIQSDIVTFEWNWNGPSLAQGQQFLLRGFRDGEWLELTRTTSTSADVAMRGKGNFETNWEWYVVVIDQRGQEISPPSRTESFGISLPNQ